MALKKKSSQGSSENKSSLPRAPRGEPQTMEELLKLYGQSSYSLSVGDRVKGKIISIDSERVVVDIGTKSEGLIAEKTFKEAEDLIKTLKVGDEIEARVIVPETNLGYTILTLREAVQGLSWKRIKDVYEKGEEIIVKGRNFNSSGLTVEVGSILGFVPTSQFGKAVSQNPSILIGKNFPARVIDFDPSSKKVILSEKEVSDADSLKKTRDAIKKIKEGVVYDGTITSLYDFGCFVKIQVTSGKESIPLEGLVHISEISWNKIEKPSDALSIGDKVMVKVIGKKGDKLALSIKQAQKDPWDEIEKKYKKDLEAKGVVSKISDFGIFVNLESGVEGLVHITKIPPDKKFKIGDSVKVYVEEVDKSSRRLSLGIVLTEKPIGYK